MDDLVALWHLLRARMAAPGWVIHQHYYFLETCVLRYMKYMKAIQYNAVILSV